MFLFRPIPHDYWQFNWKFPTSVSTSVQIQKKPDDFVQIMILQLVVWICPRKSRAWSGLWCRVVCWPARVNCVTVQGEWEGGWGGLAALSTRSSGPCILIPRLPRPMFINIFEIFYIGRLLCIILHHIILQYYIAPHPPFKMILLILQNQNFNDD